MNWFTSDWSSPSTDWLRCAARGAAARSADRDGEAAASAGWCWSPTASAGSTCAGSALRYVLGAEELPYAIAVFPWGHGFGRWHADLTNAANRDAKAELIAESVAAIQDRAAERSGIPGRQIGRLGRRGQGARAAGRADQWSAWCCWRRRFRPATTSPRALRAVRREMVVFWSPLDVIILGVGTRLFGTIDRVKTVSAGLVGFRVPPSANLDETTSQRYDKLRQIRWRPRMAATGYLGGHLGPDSPLFLRKYVVPLLRVEEIAQMLNRGSGSS